MTVREMTARIANLEDQNDKLQDQNSWFASAADSINTWAREAGLEELKIVDWDKIGEEFVHYLREFHGKINSKHFRQLDKARASSFRDAV